MKIWEGFDLLKISPLLLKEEEPLNTPEQALALMKIIDATYESARSGKPVEIS